MDLKWLSSVSDTVIADNLEWMIQFEFVRTFIEFEDSCFDVFDHSHSPCCDHDHEPHFAPTFVLYRPETDTDTCDHACDENSWVALEGFDTFEEAKRSAQERTDERLRDRRRTKGVRPLSRAQINVLYVVAQRQPATAHDVAGGLCSRDDERSRLEGLVRRGLLDKRYTAFPPEARVTYVLTEAGEEELASLDLGEDYDPSEGAAEEAGFALFAEIAELNELNAAECSTLAFGVDEAAIDRWRQRLEAEDHGRSDKQTA